MEILTFYAITLDPIEVQKLSAPQNDRLDLFFMEDIHTSFEKVARNSRKSAI